MEVIKRDQLVLHNVPVGIDVAAVVLAHTGVHVSSSWRLGASTSSSNNTSMLVSYGLEIRPQDRSNFILAAAKLRAALGAVLAKQRQVHYARLAKQGAKPKWKRGADILYNKADGKIAYCDFGVQS